jgi:murein DD-endopeptidase MepM/ murein hydrolase activator NlpD
MRALPWLLGGGAAAVALYYWTRRKQDGAPTSRNGAPLPGRWVWPVGVWRGRRPEISDGFWGLRRRPPAGYLMTHSGVDIMYRRQPGDAWKAGTSNGTPNYVMPNGRAALAASDGVVTFAANTPRGWSVVLDHSPRKLNNHTLSTYYTHLSSLLVTAKQAVTTGTPIGIVGADPLDGQHLMHLHFALREGEAEIDPEPLMASWDYLPDPESASAPGARNADTTRAPRVLAVLRPIPAWPGDRR